MLSRHHSIRSQVWLSRLCLAILVIPAAGKSWRITEKAPPPQPSKRASFFKGTLEQARLARLTDEEIASIAAALKPVLEKEEEVRRQRPFRETWGAARSMQLADNETRESHAGTVIES